MKSYSIINFVYFLFYTIYANWNMSGQLIQQYGEYYEITNDID